MIYAGIGARGTPKDINDEFEDIALTLARLKYTLRSGGAIGADSAFEKGCDFGNGKKEIWYPWQFKAKDTSPYILEGVIPEPVITIAMSIYDRWGSSTNTVQRLHARNVYQILGHNLTTPVDFVVCWTDRLDTNTGGTQFGLHLAHCYGIKTYNFHKFEEKILFKALLNSILGGKQ